MTLRISAGLLRATRLARDGKLKRAGAAVKLALRRYLHRGRMRWFRGTVPAEPFSGRSVTGIYSNHAGAREYKVYIPAMYHGQPLPLVVMLHGCKQSPETFAAGTRMNALAEELGFVVVYPRQPARANALHCWNWFRRSHQQRNEGEPSLIAGITREVLDEYGLDGARVYVAGLSAGGAMAAIMGTTYPDVYAAVGIHSGLAYAVAHDVSSAFAAMRGERHSRRTNASHDPTAYRVPTIVFHGDSDRTVHPTNGEHVIARVSGEHVETRAAASGAATVENGEANGRFYTRTMFRDGSGRELMEHWLVHGAAHAWSGGSTDGSYADPAGPDASREMLRFFLGIARRE